MNSENDPQLTSKRLLAVKKAYEKDLMAKPNVVGVGVGYRTLAGKPTDTIALVVMVEQKLPLSHLDPEDRIPNYIEGIPVDVQEVGKISAL
jgi:hypothetical protein